ncbi:MAG: hypothetical protein HY241_15340 [Actinobacteria bacterium]|nr:hypothetical protein [Actinomycetota bacterium]
MDGAPEGTRPPSGTSRIPRPWWLLLIVLFGAYLLFRLGQAVIWLAHLA